ncbi:hypothetical protein EVAR_75197_1 [Eumeta japonica]|uniref:Uncharacterized protein n=1 Tax=Eumeta variegata TaxID=151549 RepID=A0A4C1U1H1_EUMVA|nr:hypothetical protein EVAR_75197_1 [Eumeta japonica]
MFQQYRISTPRLSCTELVYSWSHHVGDRMPSTECFFSGNMSSANDSMTWDRASAQEVGSEAESLRQGGARSGEQKDKSNALGLECSVVRRVGVPLFRMKRSSLSIMLTKVLPAESTLSQPQKGQEGSTLNFHGNCLKAIAMGRDTNREKGSIISDEHSGTTVSIRSVISKADETKHSEVIIRPQPCLRYGSNGGEVFL